MVKLNPVRLSSSAVVTGDHERTPQAGPLPAPQTEVSPKREQLPTAMQVTYSKQLRRITLQRFLLSKIVYDLETVTFNDLLVLYDNLLWLQAKAGIDPGFRQKFGSFLEKLAELLKKTRVHPSTFDRTIRGLVPELKEVSEGHLLPRRNISTVEKYVKGKFHVIPTKALGKPKAELPPVRFIGIGYRDKGSRRDPALDGTPRWQEVATFLNQVDP